MKYRIRSKVRTLLAALAVVLSLGLVLAPGAEAKTALFNGGRDVTYKGCNLHAEVSDYEIGAHVGYAALLWVKVYNNAMPAGCTWEMWVHEQWWNPHTKRAESGRDFYGNMQAAGKTFLDTITYYGAIKVTGADIVLCRNYWDDCIGLKAAVLS